MLGRFTKSLSILRPRSIAQARKALDDLRQESREIGRAVKSLIEEQRRAQLELQRWNSETRAQNETLSRDLAKAREELARLALRESQLRAILRADAADEASPPTAPDWDEQRIYDHVRAALQNSELRLEPFPHVVVDNLLPRDFYDALIDGIPPAELFADNPINKRQLRVPFLLAPGYSRRVWQYMATVVVDRIFAELMVERFRAPLAGWIAERWPMLAGDPLGPPMDMHSSDGRILLRERGYHIPPHRDPKWGFLTCLIYLVRPGDSEQWGTQLFSVADDPEAAGAAPHWIDAGHCRLEREVPFRPNSALMFLNSTGAHGASIPSDAEPANLERYAYQFRVGPSRRAIIELMKLLPSEQQAMWAGKLRS